MKNIYNKIKLSPFFILLILLSLLSGLFKDIIFLFIIIVVHEFGHVVISLIYKWNIKKIYITACGGYIEYEENIDKPFKEELIIAISGILMQTVFYFICIILNKICIIDLSTLLLIRKYHYSILLFNLIPVVPLDGAKILNTLFNLYLPYRKSLNLTNLLSVIIAILIFIIFITKNLRFEYGYFVIISFVISKVLKNIKDTPFLFNRFLFERYKNPINVNKYFYIKNKDINKMRRQRKNYFYINGKYHKEIDVLRKRFD